MAVNYKPEFKDVPSGLTFLTSDGKTGASILNGKIKAEGSKFDGLDATEKNLLKAADHTGYNLPKTNINDYTLDKRGPKGTFRDFYPGDSGEMPVSKPPVNNPVMMPGTNLERRGPKGTFRDFYPGDNMPQYPQNNMQNKTNNTLVKLATMSRLGLLR